MKKQFLLFACILAITGAGCKYVQIPDGDYQGKFSCYACGFPVTESDNSTLTVIQQPDDRYTFILKTSGNADFSIQDISLTRRSTPYGNEWTNDYNSSVAGGEVNIRIYEINVYDSSNEPFSMIFEYDVDTSLTSIDFEGHQ